LGDGTAGFHELVKLGEFGVLRPDFSGFADFFGGFGCVALDDVIFCHIDGHVTGASEGGDGGFCFGPVKVFGLFFEESDLLGCGGVVFGLNGVE